MFILFYYYLDFPISHAVVTGFPNFTFGFQSIDCVYSRKGTFLSCDLELSVITLSIEWDLYSVKTNQHINYLPQRSFSSKVVFRIRTLTHTDRIDCSTWTTRLVGNYSYVGHPVCLQFNNNSVLSCTNYYSRGPKNGDSLRSILFRRCNYAENPLRKLKTSLCRLPTKPCYQ